MVDAHIENGSYYQIEATVKTLVRWWVRGGMSRRGMTIGGWKLGAI
jgi:hypothetical protein